MNKKPVMLIILDGWGLGKEYPGNAIYLGNTPNFDNLIKNKANTRLDASGEAVGLPEGQMGNSEVGHLNIGAGRVVLQELPRLNNEVETKKIFEKKEFLDGIQNAKKNNSKIHLVGLVSDGGVHSHSKHLYGLLEMMKEEDFDNVFIHNILDGRDVPPTIGLTHTKELIKKTKEIGVGKIATVSGRYYSMDRDKRWERTKLAYDAMTLGVGNKSENVIEAIQEYYAKDITDEFIKPTVITKNGVPITTVDDNDTIIFFNFRPDRARQLTRAFVDKNFEGFEREKTVKTHYITMTEYDKSIKNVNVAYKSEIPKNTLSEVISKEGLNQIKIAETEKYAHVTFFLNGGLEPPYKNEDRELISSPNVATYDLMPEMSAEGVKNEVLKSLDKDKYDLLVVNFANPDMVGHTGKVSKVVEAIEKVDKCLGEVLEKLEEKNGIGLITADHGNAEYLLDEDNNPVTAHTTNQVPLIMVGKDNSLKEGKLADLAPTILSLMGINKPEEMTGESLIIKEEQ